MEYNGNNNKNSERTLVSKSILEKAAELKDRLMSSPFYHLYRGSKTMDALDIEAIKHSASMEIENEGVDSLKKRKIEREDTRNLEEATNWARRNYNGTLNEDFIKTAGKLANPFDNSEGYRKVRVTIRGATWNPPVHEKVTGLMDKFVKENNELENIIDKAVHAHFHIAKIHPFYDGNGRTSRLVQNAILNYGKYPPIIIRETEKQEYIAHLDKAVNSYVLSEGKMTSEKNEFYNFLAEKIVSSFNEAIETERKNARKK